MVRLMDIGLERLRNLILDMAKFSEKTVSTAIAAYREGKDLTDEIYNSSEDLRILQDEASELAVELIARYQPVASDLRFIKSCMEIAYGFSRFGRYAYDISQVLKIFEDLSACDKTAIEEAGKHAEEMIEISIKAFAGQDIVLAKKLREMDEVVDKIYLYFVKTAADSPKGNIKCSLSGTLILRYIERIADHATYIGDSVVYIVSGERAARK
jgi:phosphate transport system protein